MFLVTFFKSGPYTWIDDNDMDGFSRIPRIGRVQDSGSLQDVLRIDIVGDAIASGSILRITPFIMPTKGSSSRKSVVSFIRGRILQHGLLKLVAELRVLGDF